MTRMRHVDPVRVVALVEEIAAQEVTPRFRNLAAGDITDKGGGDYVTAADAHAERRLTADLAALLPGSIVIGEEAAHEDSTVIDRIADSRPVWIIDPVDGTNNFTRGNPLFAVMVALVVNDESILGVIHMPMRGVTAVAERGSGAFLSGTRIQSAAPRPMGEMRASIHTHYLPKDVKGSITSATDDFASNEQIYCAGQVYAGLAEGRLDGALFWRTKPWDHAMGALILEEAGGHVAFADDERYRPSLYKRTGLIAASGHETWAAVRDRLFPARS